MSRCFPYPPPGYLRQGLVESIKLERENVLPKIEQKIHKKREKKEKKKERKEKGKTQGPIKKYKKLGEVPSGCKDDQLDNSDITEEHGPPVCYISDGSQNSNKRKRETLSYSECRVDGNVIKIRFSLKKPREPDASLNEETSLVCSTSGRADSSTLTKTQEQCSSWSKKPNTSTPVPEQKQWCDDEWREPMPCSSVSSVYNNEMQKAAMQYKTLVEDWKPLPLEVLQNDDDQDDWLFTTKRQGKPACRRSEVDNDVTCRASATSCPRARFLPEAEIYALPYTVPF